jgi:hypothetical protein
MPNPPKGTKEWIELFNPTGVAADLAGWSIADGTGENVVELNGMLMPTQYTTVELSTSRLNNGGDVLTLRDTAGDAIDEATYGDWNDAGTNATAPESGQAIARVRDGADTDVDQIDFNVTTTPTPGSRNTITAPIATPSPPSPSPAPSPSSPSSTKTTTTKTIMPSTVRVSADDKKWIDDLLHQLLTTVPGMHTDSVVVIEQLTIYADGRDGGDGAGSALAASSAAPTPKGAAMVSGMVIVAPDKVWKGYMAVRTDAGDGVQVHLPTGSTAQFIEGDRITASGTWSTAKTAPLPRLLVKKDEAIDVIGHDDPLPPATVPLAEIETHVGEIIETRGAVVERQPTRVRIADGDTTVLVPVDKTRTILAGDTVTARGLLVHDGTDLRILPLDTDAVTVSPRSPPAAQKPAAVRALMPYAIALAPAGILSTAVYLGSRTRKKGGDPHGRGKEKTVS